MKPKLFIIDSYSFIFRAYHVQPALTTSKGINVNAIYGFTSMIMKIINDFNPKFIVATFDSKGKTFRSDIYPEYKAHRPPAPEDLIEQLPLARKVTENFGIHNVEKQGVEADDIIASLAVKYQADYDIVIISSDKDLMQLINSCVSLYDSSKSKHIYEGEVMEKFGIPPSKVLDYLALIGDSADNIPGIAGIGPKTAVELLNTFETLEGVLENADHVKQPKRRASLQNGKEVALLSRKLITLKKDIEFDFGIENLQLDLNEEKLLGFLNEYEFESLKRRMSKLNIESYENGISAQSKIDIIKVNAEILETEILDKSTYSGILLLYIQDNTIYFSNNIDDAVYSMAPSKESLALILRYLEEDSIKKIVYDLKGLIHFLNKNIHKANLAKLKKKYNSFEDVMLMHYLVKGPITNDLSGIANAYLAASYNNNGECVRILKTLYNELLLEILKTNNYSVYKKIDLPLCQVLFDIENEGVYVDQNMLHQISADLGKEIKSLEEKIFSLTKEEFNIGSPKQLGEVLFEKLELPFGKAIGKTKNYSTNISVLERLSEAGFSIADYLIDWREVTKLKNTYSDTLPKHINEITGRAHTTLSQVGTSTARLSSHNPNLQNIPIRTKRGKQVRKTFIAKKGYKIISADYSQIELRILANIGNVNELKKAFENNVDIHTSTASQIFRIHESQITKEHRRKAKAINFGIIYGISAFGLAKQLNINNMEAKNYINNYFAMYPGVQNYMNLMADFSKKNGYAPNIFGRRIFIRSAGDKGFTKGFAERAAINAPIQSTNADIIKIAMINLQKELEKNNYKTRMILQIHDEILFEAPIQEVEIISKMIKNVMESCVEMNIPIEVNVHAGDNWLEAH